MCMPFKNKEVLGVKNCQGEVDEIVSFPEKFLHLPSF